MKYFIMSGTPSDDFLQAASSLEVADQIAEADIIIGEPTHEELATATNLKWLQMTWAGADRYLDAFVSNVTLTTASGAYGQTISEHVLAMLFSLCRRLPAYAKKNDWRDLGSEKQVQGATALIFGAGDIGCAVAKRLKALGVFTIGVCRDPKKSREGFDVRTNLENAIAFLPEADFVICALPHSEETKGYFNEYHLRLLKNDAVLINVGLGSLIDTKVLTSLLQEGKFFGVGLDVVAPEPLPQTHPLWSMPNVILTPHVAGIGIGHLPDTEKRIWEICTENLQHFLAGEPLRNVVRE